MITIMITELDNKYFIYKSSCPSLYRAEQLLCSFPLLCSLFLKEEILMITREKCGEVESPGIPAGQEEDRARGNPGIDRAGPAGTEAGPRAGSEPGAGGPEVQAGARSTAGAAGRTEG